MNRGGQKYSAFCRQRHMGSNVFVFLPLVELVQLDVYPVPNYLSYMDVSR